MVSATNPHYMYRSGLQLETTLIPKLAELCPGLLVRLPILTPFSYDSSILKSSNSNNVKAPSFIDRTDVGMSST